MRKVDILGIGFDNTDVVGAVTHAIRLMEQHSGEYLLAPGYDTVLEAGKREKLRRALRGADTVLPSGRGLIAASYILGTPIKHEIPGETFASALLARMSDLGMSVYILGEGYTVERAAAAVLRRYPGLSVAGTTDLRLADDQRAAEVINAVSPDLLLVGLPGVRQELWIARNIQRLNAGLIAGLGDVLYAYADDPIPAKERRALAFLDLPVVIATTLWQRISGAE